MTRRPITGGIVPLPPATSKPPAGARPAPSNLDRLVTWWRNRRSVKR